MTIAMPQIQKVRDLNLGFPTQNRVAMNKELLWMAIDRSISADIF